MAMELLRDRMRMPLHPLSGFRCRTYNDSIGATPGSLHTLAMAVDIATPPELTDREFMTIAETISEFAMGGIGIYEGYLHLDIRTDGPARWVVIE